ncbi:uncharacterized protein METZ01_LOCUS457978 [marine metagenome]|uniref:Uncharacterized protein n=1 Tax=marine metagenome TaxID=408172 RepID=A0A383ABT1_9ZZZZ
MEVSPFNKKPPYKHESIFMTIFYDGKLKYLLK